MHVRIDHAALVRGHTEPGEVCEIAGIGPMPVATARALAADSIRSPRATYPSARFAGLEIDHMTGYAITRDTTLEDLARLCEWHHYLKTHQGYRIVSSGGAAQWLPPDAAVAERAPPTAA